MTITREGEAGRGEGCVFRVRFIPRGPGKGSAAAGVVTVGSYDDLDVAVTISAVGYGAKDAEWMPADDEQAIHRHGVKAWRARQRVEAGSDEAKEDR